MTQPNQATHPISPVPEPRPIGFQRISSLVLVIGGSIAVVVGLFMPWFTIDVGDLGGSSGLMLSFSEGPEDTAWTSIGDVATLILIGACGAGVGPVFVLAGSFGAGYPSRDRVADYLTSAASLVVGIGLLLAWIEWEEFSSNFLIFADEAMPGLFDAMYGNGPWVTIAGSIALVSGLTLHLTRLRSDVVTAQPATALLVSAD